MEKKDYKYTETHEWIRIEGKVCTVGITDYAQEQLDEVTLVEFPEEPSEVEQNEKTGVVLESHKNVTDINSPLSGIITEFNMDLEDTPELINQSPYEKGWIYKMELSDSDEIDNLMSYDEYEAFIKEELD